MYKIKSGNLVFSALLILIAIIVGLGTGFLQLFIQPLPVWLLLSALVIFIISSLVLYPNGQIKDLIILSFLKFTVYFVTMGVIIAILLTLGKTALKPNLIMDLSLFSIIVPVFFAIGSIRAGFNIERILQKPREDVSTEIIEKETSQNQQTPEVTSSDTKPIQQRVEPLIKQNEIQQTIQDTIASQKPAEIILETTKTVETEIEEVIQEAPKTKEEPTPEIFFEDIAEVSFEHKSTVQEAVEEITTIKEEPKTESVKQIKITNQNVTEEREEPSILLEELPELTGELDTLMSLDNEEALQEEESITENNLNDSETIELLQEKEDVNASTASTETISHTPNNTNYVKTHIPQLVEAPKSKDKPSAGKITSIGKLLVDQRDIENIIETNALMQHISSDGTTTQIISTSSGNKTNEKVKEIQELGFIKSVIIVSDSGFVQKSTLEDIHKEQLLGAMTSGTFGILSSLLKKLGFQLPKDIVFETDTGWVILSKHSSDIFAIFIEPGKPLYKTTSLNEKINSFNSQNKNEFLAKISATVGIIGTVISSEHGDLIASKLIDESKEANDIAVMLPSFYSNTNILAKNMDQGPLKNIIINTGNNILLVNSIKSHIMLLYSTVNTAIVPEDYKNKLDSIINT